MSAAFAPLPFYSRLAVRTAPSSGARPKARAGVWAHARRGPQRRWWSEAWDDDAGTEGWALDGPLAHGSSGILPSQEQATTIFCSDGTIVQLGARPDPLQRSVWRRTPSDSLPLPGEQGLCIGSVFTISATNGLDVKRKLNLRGFCFSTDQLYEQVEDTVLARGGEVFETQRLLKSGVHEALVMTVAIPYLWGVPPEYERLKAGIKTGGGIIERVTWHWYIY